MRGALLAAWLGLLAVGGASAALFWSSVNRVLGASAGGRDWIGLGFGLLGVLLTLVVARWVLARYAEMGEVSRGRDDGGSAGDGSERSGEHVRHTTAP
ncbi:MAG: hypothetical protein NZL87_05945 [Thermomicrobium sp.]|nr:hypothetical protein [Thermomicrobium sp.]MDW7981843.1 hypothetical protein [Thermomicrobium sp.]